MLDFFVYWITRLLLSLRYRIRIKGLDEIAAKGRGAILFLPNHPALIDPVIMMTLLHRKFGVGALADKDQIDRPVIRTFARRMGVRPMPSIEIYGAGAREEIQKVLGDFINDLKGGKSMVIWPAGRIYRTNRESLGAASSVERILKACPGVRVVLVRTSGLWGSAFGWANGRPNIKTVLVNGALGLLSSFVFFAPKREVEIEFYEPGEALPRDKGRAELNAYLENYYNARPEVNVFVPYSIWSGRKPRVIPQRQGTTAMGGGQEQLPESIRMAVFEYLGKATGQRSINPSDDLARDLGMDSLARTDVAIWLQKEFGHELPDPDSLQKVDDVILAAAGRLSFKAKSELKPAGRKWFKDGSDKLITTPQGTNIADVFLWQARRNPSMPVVADQTVGVKTFRDIVTACMVLKGEVEKIEGQYLGLMFPGSVGADVFYLSTLFAGKVPVMINWTLGSRVIKESLNSLGIKKILTARQLASRLASQGLDLSEVQDSFVYVEDIAGRVGLWAKLGAKLASYVSWAKLERAKIPHLAAVLFTSGSEAVPKAVGLTHDNIFSNLLDVLKVIKVYESDRLIGFLPPFHSFGLTATMLTALCGGLRTVYYPNPLESGAICKMIKAYKVTMLIGTPAFLDAIMRAAGKGELESLRLIVTGADVCPPRVYESLKAQVPGAKILEGYGVTECSPIVSLNDEDAPVPYSIGKLLPSFSWRFLDPQTLLPVASNRGLLCVSGPSVFEGYLNYGGRSPFVEIDGKRFYITGDIIEVDDKGVMVFKGRLKRFIKLGGEMISLPAIEAVLEKALKPNTEKGPAIAIEASVQDPPEIVLFTTLDIDRESVNNIVRQGGLSGLHSVRNVIKLDELPVLGTGKTDYRKLKARLG